LARFYLFLIIVRHPKVVTLVYSPLTKSLTEPWTIPYFKIPKNISKI